MDLIQKNAQPQYRKYIPGSYRSLHQYHCQLKYVNHVGTLQKAVEFHNYTLLTRRRTLNNNNNNTQVLSLVNKYQS